MAEEINKISEQATAHFKNGYNCAQSVALTFADKLNISQDTLASLAQPFGGGVCRMREICGAVSGMMICHGLKNGNNNPSDKENKDNVYTTGQDLCNEFIKQNGSIICKELLGLVPMGSSQPVPKESPEPSDRTAEYYKKRPCEELVGISARIVGEKIAEMNK